MQNANQKDKKFKHSNGVKHRVYDCSISNLEERLSKSQVFDTGQDVMNFLGIGKNKLLKIRGFNGDRVTRDKDGKQYVVRLIG